MKRVKERHKKELRGDQRDGVEGKRDSGLVLRGSAEKGACGIAQVRGCWLLLPCLVTVIT